MVNEWTRNDLPKQRPMIEMYADAYRDESNVRPPMALVLDAVVEHLNEHHPKPAREVTRKDLPDFGAMGSVMARWKVSYGAVSDVLDAVVAHLNANGGLPADDRWRRAHEIVEQERDQAREQRDIWAKSAHEFRDIVETAERERDEWRDRAERFRDAIRSHPSMRGTAGMSGGTDDDFVVAVNAQLDQLSDDAEKWMIRAENAEWGMEHPAEKFVPAVDRDKLAQSLDYAISAKGHIPVVEYTTDVVMQFLKSCESKFDGARWSNAGLEAEVRRRTEALRQNLHGVEAARDEWQARVEKAKQLIPVYAMLDVWLALGRDSIHFDDWYDDLGYADAWAELVCDARDCAEAAEKRHTWPKVTPTGHTYVAPDTYVALCHQHSNAAQAEVECWEADECPPEPTWEMVGIAHREVERIQRDYCECQEELIEASLERDQWMARAEAAERERDEALEASALFQRDVHAWRARAEAAEARTAPAVTKAEIEECIYGSQRAGGECDEQGFVPVHIQEAVGQLWDLHEGDDPAVLVVRESGIAAIKVDQDSHGEWFADGEHVYVDDARQADHLANEYMTKAVRRFAVARAIEQDTAADPLLGKAQEFAALADWELTDREAELLHTVAAHVLGKEADDE